METCCSWEGEGMRLLVVFKRGCFGLDLERTYFNTGRHLYSTGVARRENV